MTESNVHKWPACSTRARSPQGDVGGEVHTPLADRDRYSLEQSVGHLLSSMSRVYERQLDMQLRRVLLNRLEFKVLAAIGLDGCATPSGIADLLAVEKAAISRALRSLEKAGLTRIGSTERDQRLRVISLTPLGSERLVQAIDIAVATQRRIFRELDATEFAHLGELLSKLRFAHLHKP